jgi:hypothetical protein
LVETVVGQATLAHRFRRQERSRAGHEALLQELARGTGLGGKARRAGSPTEKARLNVTRTIRHVTVERPKER